MCFIHFGRRLLGRHWSILTQASTHRDGHTGCTEVGTLTYNHTLTGRLAKVRERPLTSRPCLYRMTNVSEKNYITEENTLFFVIP